MSSSPGCCCSCSALHAEAALWCVGRAEEPPGSVVPGGGYAGVGRLSEGPTLEAAAEAQHGRAQSQGHARRCFWPPLNLLGNALSELHGLHSLSTEKELRVLLCFL